MLPYFFVQLVKTWGFFSSFGQLWAGKKSILDNLALWGLTGKALKHFLYKQRGHFQFEIIINILVRSFRFIWIPLLWVYGQYKYFTLSACSARESALDIRIWRLMTSIDPRALGIKCVIIWTFLSRSWHILSRRKTRCLWSGWRHQEIIWWSFSRTVQIQ